ncbi:unnamed protein product [Owenia fusiformis]|uniref:Uncharacterized protein n=1 Tax=Owenia fusiformis TaxID=6347 RepID=A0A8J1UJJ7_OWEFU|nr:unnamed protein product [Owenia fusiformis]
MSQHGSTLSLAQRYHYDVSMKGDGSEAYVILPGLSYYDFDRTGNPNIWKLQKLLSLARGIVYHDTTNSTGKPYVEYNEMIKDRFTFMASAEIELSDEFYKMAGSVQVPLSVHVNLGYIGNSSILSMANAYHGVNNGWLIKSKNTIVTVDPETRRPKPLPSWWKEKYRPICSESGPFKKEKILKATNCYRYETKVRWSDTDRYKHTNQASYIYFCLDAATDASLSNFYENIQGDFCKYHIKKITMGYHGESVANDTVVIETWQMEDKDTVHFQISKKGIENVIFQCTIVLSISNN